MELTKRAEALKEDLSLSKLLDVVIDICKKIETKSEAEPIPSPELKSEPRKKKK